VESGILHEVFLRVVYFGRDKIILKNRNLIKQKTTLKRRKLHLLNSTKV
jgi:hypothetical protein